MPGLAFPQIVAPRLQLTSCCNVSISLAISEGVHDLQLPLARRILNIVIMVWVSCSSFMSHFLILIFGPLLNHIMYLSPFPHTSHMYMYHRQSVLCHSGGPVFIGS